jgi:ureidoglycolate dehydrogenase (NAD+)
MELAREAGSGLVAVRNSTHCGAMAYFALEACAQDGIGLAFTHATPKMRTPNTPRPFFGANPICVAAPMAREGPFCFDASVTVMSGNGIRLYGEEGRTLPPGCAADGEGRETRDPARFEQLLPIGDYKGFGLAMVVDLLCALFTGMPSGDGVSDMFGAPLSEKRFLGQFFGALRIDAFEEPQRFRERLQDLADRVRREPRADPSLPVQVPGDPEKAHEADRRRRGIPVRASEKRRLDEIAERLSVRSLGG